MRLKELNSTPTSRDIMQILKKLIYDNENQESLTYPSLIKDSSLRYAYTINIMNKYLDKKRKIKILDFGLGEGYMSLLLKYFFPSCLVSACDVQINEKTRKLLNKNGIKTINNVSFYGGIPLPFDDCYFDAILFTEVLEHIIENPKYVFSELHRIMKTNGVMYFSTPNIAHIYNRILLLLGKQPQLYLNSLNKNSLQPRGHFREWTMNELLQLLKPFFIVIEKKYFRAIHQYGLISQNRFLKLLYYPYCFICMIIPSFRSQIFIVAYAS